MITNKEKGLSVINIDKRFAEVQALIRRNP